MKQSLDFRITRLFTQLADHHGITVLENKRLHFVLEYVVEVPVVKQQWPKRLLNVWMFHGLHYCPWTVSTKYVVNDNNTSVTVINVLTL